MARRRFVALLLLGTAVSIALVAGLGPATQPASSTAGEPGGHGARSGGPVVPPARARAAVDRLIGLGEPVRCGGGREPVVALTFDDGPGPLTARTLNVLRRHGARATFFLVARQIEAWPAYDWIPRRQRRRHAVGNHTFDHVALPGTTGKELARQIGGARDAIADASGGEVTLFRPPYGARDASVDTSVRDHGMLQILWSVDSMDSRGIPPEEIVANVAAGIRPGAIVLLHENRGTTLRALPEILDLIARRGYHAVTGPELLAIDPPTTAQLRAGTCP
ncbi:MAG: polysaccharide deacetylase family protein [Actinobacteria bacterium]|nr:polysaccharide deacetylase family protein [Actinomycetota bacterium]